MICVHDEDVTLFKIDEGVFREGWGESVDIFCHLHMMKIENFSLLSMTDLFTTSPKSMNSVNFLG